MRDNSIINVNKVVATSGNRTVNSKLNSDFKINVSDSVKLCEQQTVLSTIVCAQDRRVGCCVKIE